MWPRDEDEGIGGAAAEGGDNGDDDDEAAAPAEFAQGLASEFASWFAHFLSLVSLLTSRFLLASRFLPQFALFFTSRFLSHF